MNTKISLIGAGSAQFSLNLIIDLCVTPNLAGAEVSFMDVDESRLATAVKLCQRYADALDTKLTITATTDRRESLKGADFVIDTAFVLGNTNLYNGINIARKHGYRFGGSFHIMHDEAFWGNYYQFKFFEEITEDILEICPDAWHLLVANPVLAGTTQLQRKYPEAKMVGLCHGFGGLFHIARVMGLDPEQLTFELPGVNHFIWLTKAFYKGQDFFPLLKDWIANKAEEYWVHAAPSDSLSPKAIDLFQRFEVFPIGDTCTPGGGSWPYWYHTDVLTEAKWEVDPNVWWEGHFKRVLGVPAYNEKLADDKMIDLLEKYPPKLTGEPMVGMIESIVCDIPRKYIVNMLNKGNYVPGIPANFEVEVPAMVSKSGIQPIQTDGLPPELISFALRDRVAPVEVELAAYRQGRKELLLQLILMDPWTKSEAQAKALLEEILEQQWAAEMREHYQ